MRSPWSISTSAPETQVSDKAWGDSEGRTNNRDLELWVLLGQRPENFTRDCCHIGRSQNGIAP